MAALIPVTWKDASFDALLMSTPDLDNLLQILACVDLTALRTDENAYGFFGDLTDQLARYIAGKYGDPGFNEVVVEALKDRGVGQ